MPSSFALAKRKFQGLPSVVVVEVAKLRFEKISLSSLISMSYYFPFFRKKNFYIYFLYIV